jgi:hypothetical protein
MGGDLGSFGSAGSVVYEAPGSLDYMDPSLLHVEPRRWAEEGNETATLSGVSAFPQPSNFLPRLSFLSLSQVPPPSINTTKLTVVL